MSLIDVHIQSEDFSIQNDIYNEMNVQLGDNDNIESRCGEIYISRRKILMFVCTECKESFCSYDDFFTHLCEQHLCNEELNYEESNSDGLTQDNLVIIMEPDEFEDIKPDIINKINSSQEEPSEDMLETFEIIDEYEALEESEENKTVTFLNDFSKFIEKDKNFFIDDDQVQEDESHDPTCRGSTSPNNLIEDDGIGTIQNSKFECEKCHKIFQSQARLRIHLKLHNKERNFKCNICGFAFTEEFNLRAHIRRHNGDKPHACEQCGKRFTTRNEVKAHLRSHTGERPYICEICGQSYVTSGSLNEHKKRHTNYRPHKCQRCDKTFFDSGLLKEHVVMHTGERKHICEVCEASFTRRKALLQHMKLHSGVKQYKCSFCDKAFAQKPGLASHLKTHRNLLKAIKRENDDPDNSF